MNPDMKCVICLLVGMVWTTTAAPALISEENQRYLIVTTTYGTTRDSTYPKVVTTTYGTTRDSTYPKVVTTTYGTTRDSTYPKVVTTTYGTTRDSTYPKVVTTTYGTTRDSTYPKVVTTTYGTTRDSTYPKVVTTTFGTTRDSTYPKVQMVKTTMRQTFYAIFILLAIFCLFGQFLYSYEWNNILDYKSSDKLEEVTSQSKCKLPQKNPWDESIMPYFNQRFGYRKQCNQTDNMRTKFANGLLEKKNKNDNCWGRCLYWKDDYEFTWSEWTNEAKQFKCDVIEARCSTNGNIEEFDYVWLHTQIHENEELKKTNFSVNNTSYNVLLVLLDSTSYTQSLRNIGKTVTYLTEGMNAIRFPYLNRVGKNTKPNVVALLAGMVWEKVDRRIFNASSIDEVLNVESGCHIPLDNYTFIEKEYRNNHYVTSMFEDWFAGWLNYPNCIGIKGKSAEHMNSPFRLAWSKNSGILKQQNYCDSKHQLMFDHVGQFLNSYKGMPKMTTVFDNDFGHDSVSSSLEADDILYDFFIKNRKALKKSFIFLMGDHGFRLGAATSTNLGQYEVNNPMLYVIPPADLAKNKEFMDVLRENSQKLQTHWDVRETLLDILKHQPATNFSDRKSRNDNPHGNSLLRVQNGERSCRTLPIPFQYCMCEYKEEKQNLTSVFASKIGQFVTNEINQMLSTANVSTKCFAWVFDKVTFLNKLDAVDNLDIYKVEIDVEPNAKFKTMVTDLRNGTFLMSEVDRSDIYGGRGNCVEESYRRLCDCRIKS